VDGTLVSQPAGNFSEAMDGIDAVHAEDPQRESGQPKELVYAQRMSAWLAKLAPTASEPLRLAVRCQHLRRWAIARCDFPEGKVGYLRWRKEESLAHAALAVEILGRAGYGAEDVKRVQSLIKKERIKHDPEAQLLEDTACLVFLESEFAAFAPKHDEAKLVDILRKTWEKMSPGGREAALALELPPALRAIIGKALANPATVPSTGATGKTRS
jgi:hypothetical protein